MEDHEIVTVPDSPSLLNPEDRFIRNAFYQTEVTLSLINRLDMYIRSSSPDGLPRECLSDLSVLLSYQHPRSAIDRIEKRWVFDKGFEAYAKQAQLFAHAQKFSTKSNEDTAKQLYGVLYGMKHIHSFAVVAGAQDQEIYGPRK